MVLAIPLTVKLARQQQILFSRAAQAQLIFLTKDQQGTQTDKGESCVFTKNNNPASRCPNVKFKLMAPTQTDLKLQGRASLLPQGGVVRKAYAISQGECDGDYYLEGSDAGNDDDWVNCAKQGKKCVNGQGCVEPAPSGPNHECAADGARSDEAGDDGRGGICGGHKVCHYEGDSLKWGGYRCEFCTNGVSNPPDCNNQSGNSTSCTEEAEDLGNGCAQNWKICEGKPKEKSGSPYDVTTGGKCGAGEKEGGGCPNWEFKDTENTVCGDTVEGGTDKQVCNYESDSCTGTTRAKPGSCQSVPGFCRADEVSVCWAAVQRGTLTQADVDQECQTRTGYSASVCKKVADESTDANGCTKAPQGATGVPVGTGGCCNPANKDGDCQASNKYNGDSTQGWTCSVQNQNCVGGSACKPPESGSCVARFQKNNQDPWEQTKVINKGDSIFAGALTTSTPTQDVTGATLTLRGPNGSVTLQREQAYTPSQAGDYTLTANGGGCSDATATLTVRDTGGQKCFVCDKDKYRYAGIDGSLSGCPTAACNPANSNTCRSDRDLRNQSCNTDAAPVITKFRFAEDKSDLGNPEKAKEGNYQQGGVIVSHTFSTTPGEKFIWYQFGDDTGNWTEPAGPARILLVGSDPEITGSACNVRSDIKDNSLIFEVTGENFGTQTGSISADGNTLELNCKKCSWKNDSITARMANPPDTTVGKTYNVTVNRADGAKSTSKSCAVETIQVSVGPKIYCQAPNSFDQENVNLSIFEMIGIGATANTSSSQVANQNSEKITVNRQGVSNKLKTKITPGLDYIFCVDVPDVYSLVVCSKRIKALAGNNIANFDIPIGDYNRNGKVGLEDGSLLISQFGTVTANKICDLNKDKVCNSYEWSCLIKGYNKESETKPL